MEVTVRTFDETEWAIYRDLRLAALADSPDALGGTLAQSSQRADSAWRSRLVAAAPDTDLPLICEVEGSPGGLAWGRIEPALPDDAHVYQMWVAPHCRGCAAGRRLLDAVIDWAGNTGAKRVLLGVTCGNSPARNLYDSAGFRPVGDPQPLRPGSTLLAQDMELVLSR